jgi:glycosyltransferase involved in cell wall biosynthesis
MREANILVSIIINNYNYAKFLSEAIDSALDQTYHSYEVIVVDDGSTDDSREIIESYKKKVISILKPNGGQASAFNAGFAASKGDIICFLDSDDKFLPEKIEKIVEIFEKYKDVDWCFHLLSLVDINRGVFIDSHYDAVSNVWDFRSEAHKGKLPYLPFATSSLCFKRSLLQKILPMPESTNVTLSDNYLKFISLALSKGYFLSEKLTIQKIHNSNAYTLSKNKLYLKARIAVHTSYWIKFNFPFLIKFSNNMFVDGIGISWCTRKFSPETNIIVEKYLSSVNLASKVQLITRTIYYCLKNFIRIRNGLNV